MSQLASIHLGEYWLALFPSPGFLVFYSAPRCSFLLPDSPSSPCLCFCSPTDYAYSGSPCSCHGERQTEGELLSLSPAFLAGARCSFLQRREACPSGLAGAEGQQRLHGGLIRKSPSVEFVLFPFATCFRVCFIISAYVESYHLHSGLNAILDV